MPTLAPARPARGGPRRAQLAALTLLIAGLASPAALARDDVLFSARLDPAAGVSLYSVDKQDQTVLASVDARPSNSMQPDWVSDRKGRFVYYRLANEFGPISLLRSDRKTGEHEPLGLPLAFDGQVLGFALDDKRRNLVYRASNDGSQPPELYHIDLKTMQTMRINQPLVSGGEVTNFAIDPRGRTALYSADQEQDGRFEVFVVDLKTKAVSKVNGALDSGGQVESFAYDRRGRSVVYIADQQAGTTGNDNLHVYDIKKGSRRHLNNTFTGKGGVTSFLISPRGSSVIYTSSEQTSFQNEIYSVGLKQGEPFKIAPLVAGSSPGSSGLRLGPRGRWLLFSASVDASFQRNIYCVDVKKGTTRQVNPDGTQGTPQTTSYRFDGKGRSVLYLGDQEQTDVEELFAWDVKSGEGSKLNATLPSGGDVFSFEPGPRGRGVAYVADQQADGVVESWYVDLKKGTTTHINESFEPGDAVLSGSQRFGRSSRAFYYLRHNDADGYDDLLRVDLSKKGSFTRTKLNPDLEVGETVFDYNVNGQAMAP